MSYVFIVSENDLTSPVLATEKTQKKISKKYFCPFCKNLVDHFPRHLINKHKSEEEVIRIKCMSPKSEERAKLIAKIRGRGSIMYNTNTELNKGNLIISRRSSKPDINQKQIKPCIHCHNFFKKATLWKHYRKCSGIKSAPRDLQNRSEAILLETKLNNILNVSSSLKDILPGMDKDEIYNQIINDEAIIDFGNYVCLKHTEKHD